MVQKYADKIKSLSKQIEELKDAQKCNELEVWRQAYNAGLAANRYSGNLVAIADKALSDYQQKRFELGL